MTKTITYVFRMSCKHRENFDIICIVQIMLKYFRKYTPNVDLSLKPKLMKLSYTRNVIFNINGTTINFALNIPLNQSFKKLKACSDERCDILIKTHD